MLNAQIQQHFKILINIEAKNESTKIWLFLMVKYLTIIQTVSFLDEFDNFLGSNPEIPENEIVLVSKKIVQPAIDRIREWDGMRSVRNTLLAHNLRNRKKHNQFIFSENDLENASIPNHISEYELLTKCIDLTMHIVSQPFRNHLAEYDEEFIKGDKPYIAKVVDPVKEFSEILDKIRNIKP